MTTAKPPAPPEHLAERSAALWAELVATWELGPHELELLRRLCEASDRADQARQILEAEGIVERNRFGEPRPHPAVAIERDARRAVAQLTAELRLESVDTARPRDRRRRG